MPGLGKPRSRCGSTQGTPALRPGTPGLDPHPLPSGSGTLGGLLAPRKLQCVGKT